MQFDADGAFVVVLSKERPAGTVNWMKLEDEKLDLGVDLPR